MHQDFSNPLISLSSWTFVGLFWCFIGISYTYNYNPASNNGPSSWRLGEESQACGGNRQSPVNINTSSVLYGMNLELQWSNGGPLVGYFVNNGHSPTFQIESPRILMRVSPYHGQDVFVLKQIHFHFAKTRGRGSEHTVNGYHASGEIHMVFYNARHGSFDDALAFGDGITVVAVFVNGRYGPTVRRELSNFVLTNGRKTIETGSGTYTQLSRLPVILPISSDLYMYRGSLTTPPCLEVVTWVVMRYPITVHYAVFRQALRIMMHNEAETIAHHGNHRPTQPLNNRVVYANFNP